MSARTNVIRQKDMRKAVAKVLALGWELRLSGAGHPYVVSPDGVRIGMSSTPGCPYAHLQFKRDVRKYAGVEL